MSFAVLCGTVTPLLFLTMSYCNCAGSAVYSFTALLIDTWVASCAFGSIKRKVVVEFYSRRYVCSKWLFFMVIFCEACSVSRSSQHSENPLLWILASIHCFRTFNPSLSAVLVMTFRGGFICISLMSNEANEAKLLLI